MKKLLFALFFLCFSLTAIAAEKETAYDRILRTGTIRCGYYLWPPLQAKDPNTGKLSGLFYDLYEEIGKQLSLKIEWVEEVNTATMFEGYKTGRYDVICGSLAATPARARVSDFTIPVGYFPFYMYASADDKRFDNAYAKANDPKVRYVAMDGEFGAIIAHEDYPKAQYISMPQLTDPASLLMTIATGKADVTVTDPVAADDFIKHNPGKLRRVAGDPVRVISANFSVPVGEERLKSMLNITLQGLIETGFVEKDLKNYPGYDATILRLPPPYVTPKGSHP